MNSLLLDLTANLKFHYLVRLMAFIELFSCVIFFAISFKRKHHFFIKLVLGGIFILLFIYPIAVIRANFPSLFSSILISFVNYALILILLMNLFKEDIADLFLCICAGISAQIIVGRLFEMLFLFLGKNPYTSISFFSQQKPVIDWVLYLFIHLIIGALLAFIFRRKKNYQHDKNTTHLIVVFSVMITVITVPLNTLSRSLEGINLELDMVIRIFAIMYGFFILLLRTGIIEQSKLRQDLLILDEVLHVEKKQFESMQHEIELINTKSHDIKQQLNSLGDKLTEKEVDSLKKTINFYDKRIKTGNDVLDTILYKKQLYCEKNNITLSCMADGNSLSFIKPTQLYSLLNNAIENALEATLKVSDENKRVISISIVKKHTILGLNITNYFQEKPIIIDGLPQSQKNEPNHHGFGMKSMQHIAAQYHGEVTYRIKDDIFYLRILIPSDQS